MGLHSPTPIQAATVPLALLGRDVCACAVTGSGNYKLKVLLTLKTIHKWSGVNPTSFLPKFKEFIYFQEKR
jgi:superfamily II DNA/RNA helicase